MDISELISGIDDDLAQRLTRSLPPDVLRAFVELYCDVFRESFVPTALTYSCRRPYLLNQSAAGFLYNVWKYGRSGLGGSGYRGLRGRPEAYRAIRESANMFDNM